MTAFVFRRAGQAVIVVLGVSLVTFILQHQIPGSLARAVLGSRASRAEIAAFNRANGLNRPAAEQFFIFLSHLARGDLGYSYRYNQSVDSLVAHQLPNDLLVVGCALAAALVIAIPLGVAQALHRGRAADHAVTAGVLGLYAMPSYWLGMLLAGLVISAHLQHLVPPEVPPQQASIGGLLGHPQALILPVATLTAVNVALFSRYMRAAAIGTLAQDYIVLARAKGLPARLVASRHVLRNSLISVTTLVGLSVPALITSGLVVEYAFNVPGLALTYYTAAMNADYPAELGITVLVGVVTAAGSMLADIAYAILDPRVRYG